jgi:hypothetical protein
MVFLPQTSRKEKMITLILNSQRIGDAWLGIIIPALILGLSVLLTWILYKKFSK